MIIDSLKWIKGPDYENGYTQVGFKDKRKKVFILFNEEQWCWSIWVLKKDVSDHVDDIKDDVILEKHCGLAFDILSSIVRSKYAYDISFAILANQDNPYFDSAMEWSDDDFDDDDFDDDDFDDDDFDDDDFDDDDFDDWEAQDFLRKYRGKASEDVV